MTTASASDFEQLLDVGLALSSTRRLKTLLALILTEARRFTTADAGTLYLVKEDSLCAEVGQCQTFVERWGKEKADSIFNSFSFPINRHSIAGSAAMTKEVVNIPDVQNKDSRGPFQYNPEYDRQHDYSTHSNLAVPMLDKDGVVIGVLQLINAKDGETIVSFDEHRTKLARALASQAAVAIRNAILTSDLEEAHLDTLKRLGIAAEWRDKETANHITRVSHYSGILAEVLGWEEERVRLLMLSSPMHDVGKLGIPDAILHKPGRLEPEERKLMETHTIIGANIMAKANNEIMHWSREVALGHHEKWNGKGYPKGLSNKAIPVESRIVALADVYDALSSRRCYKEAFPHEKAMAILKEETGEHFDPEVMEAFQTGLDRIIDVRDRYADKEEDFAKFRNYEEVVLEE